MGSVITTTITTIIKLFLSGITVFSSACPRACAPNTSRFQNANEAGFVI
jgi:hypothetical protein